MRLSKQLTEATNTADNSTNQTIVEYAVQFLFKRKGPAAAAKATVKNLHGHTNLMISPTTPVSVDSKKLEAAIWDRIVNQALKNVASFKPGKEDYAIEAAANHFRLGKRDGAKLNKMVQARLSK